MSPAPKVPPLLAFVCPACAAPNEVDLLALSRERATACTACKRRLRDVDVIRARTFPRAPA